MYKQVLRPLLFQLDAEQAHSLSLQALRVAAGLWPFNKFLEKRWAAPSDKNKVSLFGLDFANRVGLAAGMDKNADFLLALELLGFGHVEVGTVTPKPQKGNAKPRMFRLRKDQALINRMGFNNKGVQYLKRKLAEFPRKTLVGANIGKNKDTPNREAYKDYLYCFSELVPYCDYFTVNVSSPNTPGLRELQNKERIYQILATLQEENLKYKEPRPLLLKLAPDLSREEAEQTVQVALECGISGLVLTNTTIDRGNLSTEPDKVKDIGAGGLSGRPLLAASNSMLAFVKGDLAFPYPVVGVGGVMGPLDARAKIEAGADLVQVYSGLVYEGPSLVRRIAQSL